MVMSTQPDGDLSRRRFLELGLWPVALAPLAPTAVAQTAGKPAPLPVEDFFKPPALRSPALSPDGTQVAAIRMVEGRENVVVLDLKTSKSLIVTNFRDTDVSAVRWVRPGRLWFTLIDRKQGLGNQDPPGLFAINSDASNYRQLAGLRADEKITDRLLPAGTSVVRRVVVDGKSTDELVVAVGSLRARGQFGSSLYRLNTSTGVSRLLTLGGPDNVQAWLVDGKLVPRAAVSTTGTTTRVLYRADESKPWVEAFTFGIDQPMRAVNPMTFDGAGRLYCAAVAAGGDNLAIFRYDEKANALEAEPVFGVKGFDVDDGLIFSPSDDRLLGVAFEADREMTHWFDEGRKAVQAKVDKLLPGAVNSIQWASEAPEAPVLIRSHSDRNPGRVLVFDVAKDDIKQIAAARPWIKPEAMAPTRFFRYPARDGLSIPAQITMPAGDGPHPLVVLHYGGPWVRPISWEWDPYVQFLANRGYAVFMPAPRASTGFGMKLYQAGWKQWGLAMQDDVTDGVKFLIAEGRIDPKRVCIAGASYGGYMTMMGLVREPDLFKVGINWIGVTDPSYMLTVTWTDFNRVDAGRDTLPLLIGDAEKDKAQFERTSPVKRAAEIKQPVLMAYGGLDQRVPIINGEKMRDALKGHNPNVEYHVYPDEGHGWLRWENNVDFAKRIERFLARHMPA